MASTAEIMEGRTEYQRFCCLIDHGTRGDWYTYEHPSYNLWCLFHEAFGDDSGTWTCEGWGNGTTERKLVETLLASLNSAWRRTTDPFDNLELLFKQFLERELERLNYEEF
jgi:hypothetical protein